MRTDQRFRINARVLLEKSVLQSGHPGKAVGSSQNDPDCKGHIPVHQPVIRRHNSDAFGDFCISVEDMIDDGIPGASVPVLRVLIVQLLEVAQDLLIDGGLREARVGQGGELFVSG
jgi:hypothetical protein